MGTNWRDFIASDPDIVGGKPAVRGTRLAVEFVLGLFADGWTKEAVLDNYPQLSEEKLRAIFAFSEELVREEALYLLPSRAS